MVPVSSLVRKIRTQNKRIQNLEKRLKILEETIETIQPLVPLQDNTDPYPLNLSFSEEMLAK
jgi:hypothetical protein